VEEANAQLKEDFRRADADRAAAEARAEEMGAALAQVGRQRWRLRRLAWAGRALRAAAEAGGW
jgi:hypothetical protein